MEDLEQVIGEGHALGMSFDSSYRQISAEDWSANLIRKNFDEFGEEQAGSVISSARLVRVGLDNPQWFESLDAESADLAAVGSAFLDRDRVAEVDEDSLFADSLTIIDFIGVDPEHRGSRFSHALAHGIAHIFRGDVIALLPANLSTTDGRLKFGAAKEAGLRRHWGRAGFVSIPETDVMMLPFAAR